MHSNCSQHFEYTLCGWSSTWLSSRKYFGFCRANEFYFFSSLRGIVSMAQNHTIIYLQQLYRLFITVGSLPTQERRSSFGRSLSFHFSLRERSCHTQAHECRTENIFPFPQRRHTYGRIAIADQSQTFSSNCSNWFCLVSAFSCSVCLVDCVRIFNSVPFQKIQKNEEKKSSTFRCSFWNFSYEGKSNANQRIEKQKQKTQKIVQRVKSLRRKKYI